MKSMTINAIVIPFRTVLQFFNKMVKFISLSKEICVRIVRFGLKQRKWDHFQWTGQNGKKCKNENFDLISNNCLLKEGCPKILIIIQETNFDMGFQKINIRERYKVAVFFLGMSLRHKYLNEPKKNFYKLSSWDFFFFKLQLLFYMKIYIT